MDRSKIQRAMMSGVHGERKRKEEDPGVVKTSKCRRRVCVKCGSLDHIKKPRGGLVGPLDDRCNQGTASEDQGNRWTHVREDQGNRWTHVREDQGNRGTHFNWWLLRLDGFFADVVVALEIEIASTSRQQRLRCTQSNGKLWSLGSGCRGTSWKIIGSRQRTSC
ncbi:unnamed protein product [Caenorhabditis nigoni]